MVARYAGRVADGFICTSGKGRELYADQLVPAVDEGLDKAGRADEIDRMIEVKLSWDPDPEQALANTRFWAPLSLTAEQKHSIHSPAEMERGGRRAAHRAGGQALGRRLRPEDVVEALRVYTDLGFDHLVVHGPGHDQERFLSTFAEQVLPGLRELTPRRGERDHVPARCPPHPLRCGCAAARSTPRARRSWRSPTAPDSSWSGTAPDPGPARRPRRGRRGRGGHRRRRGSARGPGRRRGIG